MLLYLLQRECSLNDIKGTKEDKREIKQQWIEYWKEFNKELNMSTSEIWVHLVILEDVTFFAYTPLGDG